jgi:hypothetical protein
MNPAELKARCGRAIASALARAPHRTYQIGPSGKTILCLTCGKISHHPMDVANLYCGHCHKFHEPGLPAAPESGQ